MRYTIYLIDCQLNSILEKTNVEDTFEAEEIYNNYKKEASKIRYAQVFMFDDLLSEYISEENF